MSTNNMILFGIKQFHVIFIFNSFLKTPVDYDIKKKQKKVIIFVTPILI